MDMNQEPEFRLSMLDGRELTAEDFAVDIVAITTQSYGVVVETNVSVVTYPWQSVESVSISK